MSKWEHFFMGLAQYVATASKDPSTKVGAVVVDQDKIVRGLGYNGFPRGVHDTKARYENRDIKYKLVVHAEANAILNANSSVRGCTLYSTKFPCAQCAALIIQSGIRTIVSPPGNDPRWEEDQKLAKVMFAEADITLYTFGKEIL